MQSSTGMSPAGGRRGGLPDRQARRIQETKGKVGFRSRPSLLFCELRSTSTTPTEMQSYSVWKPPELVAASAPASNTRGEKDAVSADSPLSFCKRCHDDDERVDFMAGLPREGHVFSRCLLSLLSIFGPSARRVGAKPGVVGCRRSVEYCSAAACLRRRGGNDSRNKRVGKQVGEQRRGAGSRRGCQLRSGARLGGGWESMYNI